MFSYTSNSYILKKFKLNSYDKNSLSLYSEYLGKDDILLECVLYFDSGNLPINPDIFKKNTYQALLGYGDDVVFEENPYIMILDNQTKNHIKKEIDLFKFEEQYELYLNEKSLSEKFRSKEYEEIKNLVSEINKSVFSCIKFVPKLAYYFNKTKEGLDNPVKFSPEILISLKIPGDSDYLTTIDDPTITSLPSTRGGTLYNRIVTENKILDIGEASVVKAKDEDRDYLPNKAAGYLDVVFNDNTGKFEAGTRAILARVLSDLPGVTYDSLPDNIDLLSYNDFYGKNSPYAQAEDWLAEVHTAEAITLYVHNDNPNLFGPMFIEDNPDDKKEIEKIILVNRTKSSFEKDELVIAFFLDREWIPIKIPEGDAKPPSLNVLKWSFNKIIMNHHTYFKDERWALWKEGDSSYDAYNRIYSPSSYLNAVRIKFFQSLLMYPGYKDLALLNLGNDQSSSAGDIKPPTFIQSTIFDQVSPAFGGKSEQGNLFDRTNYYQPFQGRPWTPDDSNDYEFLGFWGPVFKDGFRTEGVIELENRESTKFLGGNPEIAAKFFSIGKNGLLKDLKKENNLTYYNSQRNTNYSFFSDVDLAGNVSESRDYLNIPAELGLLNSFDNNNIGSPIEDLNYTLSFLNEGYHGNFFQKLKEIQDYNQRFAWLSNLNFQRGGSEEPFYNLTPKRPNHIDFIPLSAEMIGNMYISNEASSPVPPFVNFQSSTSFRFLEPISTYMRKGFKYFKDKIPYWKQISSNLSSNNSNFALHNLRTWGETDKTANGNVVGIISSKTTIKLTGSIHKIIFNLDQYFGYPLYTAVPGGGTDSTTGGFAGMPLSNNPGGNGAYELGISTWGTFSNEIHDMNITALFVQIYDAWPAEQTIVDPRFFTVLHFNPGIIDTNDGETSVDLPWPTDIEKNKIEVNKIIEIDKVDFDKNNWKKDYSRRGQLLSLSGFKYFNPYLSVNGLELITESPDNGRYGSQGLNVIINDGSISAIESGGENILSKEEITLSGLGEENSGKRIKVKILSYILKTEIKTDLPPTQRVAPTLLTDRNQDGKPTVGNNGQFPGIVNRSKSESITFEDKNRSGLYDVFFHFHNDITHTIHGTNGSPPTRQQHVCVEMTTE